MGNNNQERRIMKLEKAENLLRTPLAVVFQWPGETQEAAWRRHLELRPKDELAPYRAYIQFPKGKREKEEPRLYGYRVVYEYPEEQSINFEDDELRRDFMNLLLKARRRERAGDLAAKRFLGEC
jgi:hypothetical protein